MFIRPPYFTLEQTDYGSPKNTPRLTLALKRTTWRPAHQACLHRWDPLIWVFLPIELFDLYRLDESHVTAAAAVLAPAALPPVLADATAAAVLAHGAPPPVLADAAAAAVLAVGAPPPVLADAAAAAVLAHAAPPPVLAEAAAAAVLALAALPPMLADAAATAVLAPAAHPAVLAEAAAAAVLAPTAAAARDGPVLAEAYCGGGRPFFLFTPTIEFRKSFARAVRSFERAPVCSRCANPSTPGTAPNSICTHTRWPGQRVATPRPTPSHR